MSFDPLIAGSYVKLLFSRQINAYDLNFAFLGISLTNGNIVKIISTFLTCK